MPQRLPPQHISTKLPYRQKLIQNAPKSIIMVSLKQMCQFMHKDVLYPTVLFNDTDWIMDTKELDMRAATKTTVDTQAIDFLHGK